MPAVDVLTGVSQINISQRSPGNATPSMAAVSMTVAVVPADAIELNSPQQSLLTTDTYEVTLAEVCFDKTKKGYTIGIANSLSGGYAPTNPLDVFHVHIDSANLPAGSAGCIGMMLFLKINGADPQALGFAQVDAGTDFDYFVTSKPINRA